MGSPDEKELLLGWLDYLRGAVLRNLGGLNDQQAMWTPDDRLTPILGIVNHLTQVEWRWIDGTFGGVEVNRSEEEFRPEPRLRVDEARAPIRHERQLPTQRSARSP